MGKRENQKRKNKGRMRQQEEGDRPGQKTQNVTTKRRRGAGKNQGCVFMKVKDREIERKKRKPGHQKNAVQNVTAMVKKKSKKKAPRKKGKWGGIIGGAQPGPIHSGKSGENTGSKERKKSRMLKTKDRRPKTKKKEKKGFGGGGAGWGG